MVLNVKNLRQKSGKEYEQNFDWGMNILKGYRQEVEDDNSRLLTFLSDKIDIKQMRSEFELRKSKFLDEYYYGKESKNDCSERFKNFLKVVEGDLNSFYIFSKVVVTTSHENLINELVWNNYNSKLEIKGDFSGLMKKDTEIEVSNYISYLLNSFFIASEFSKEDLDIGRIGCLWNIISDIHLLLFNNRITKNHQIKFSFNAFDLEIFNYKDFDKNSVYIGEFIDHNERSAFEVMIAKCLCFDNIKEEILLSFFCDKLKEKLDKLLADLLIMDSPNFKLEKVESGFIPLFMFTDSQILNCIKEGENTYSFSTIKSIKKITSEEQFERFMNLLSKI